MGHTAGQCRQLKKSTQSVLTCVLTDKAAMQEDTTKNNAEWKGRIQYNDKIPLLQLWFSSMLSPLVPIGFYLELKGWGFFMSVISHFAILPASSLMLSSPVSPPLHCSHSLFSSLWVILFSQPKLSRVYCFVLILSARILISLCFTEACYSTALSTSVFP